MLIALPCIACGRELQSCARPNQPLDGLAFSSRGHYGTTVFDPMDGSALEINVCDDCLERAGERRRVLLYPAQQATPGFHRTAWMWGASDAEGSEPEVVAEGTHPGRLREASHPSTRKEG